MMSAEIYIVTLCKITIHSACILQTIGRSKIGYNHRTNRACFVSKDIEHSWLSQPFDSFKVLCKCKFL